jgi:hypothetical protein
MDGKMDCWLIGWLVGWLVGWLASQLFIYLACEVHKGFRLKSFEL